MERRQFVKTLAVGCGVLILPKRLKATDDLRKQSLRFGFCADVYKDI